MLPMDGSVSSMALNIARTPVADLTIRMVRPMRSARTTYKGAGKTRRVSLSSLAGSAGVPATAPALGTGASRVRHGCATVEPRLLRVPTANRLRAICLAAREPAWIIRFHSLMSSEHIAHCPLPATLDHRTTP